MCSVGNTTNTQKLDFKCAHGDLSCWFGYRGKKLDLKDRQHEEKRSLHCPSPLPRYILSHGYDNSYF